ncbi:MAG: GNAT family N-acetyltransferase [Chloroflexota bacterium]|nr:GNAT family N-acetyltransferase [Chloroflexota bacterium]
MPDFRLREATDVDAAVILVVLRAANGPYRHRPNGPSGAFSDTVEGTRGMIATFPVVLAVAGETVVGCLFYAFEADHCFLFRLGVLPAYQRRGIGRALMEYAEGRAVQKGLSCMRLGVRRAMPENRDYYERLGYCVTETTDSGWTMEKATHGEEWRMKTDDFTIREATDADVPAVVGVLRTAFAEQATLAPPSGALSETEESVRALMETARIALAVVDGRIGGCQFFEPKGDHLYLFRLAVLPDYRQHGIGGALIAYAEAQARAMDLPRAQFSVRLALPRQRAFYERMGYRVVGLGTHAGFAAPTSATLEKAI